MFRLLQKHIKSDKFKPLETSKTRLDGKSLKTKALITRLVNLDNGSNTSKTRQSPKKILFVFSSGFNTVLRSVSSVSKLTKPQ